jgi:HD-like signal output (HDOD) protein
VNHREVGAAILAKWNFPDLFTDLAREHQSLTITSPHKELIVLVGIAEILAESARVLGARKAELLAGLLPHSSLTGSDLEYYRTRFLADLGQDPQVRESHSLFGILS